MIVESLTKFGLSAKEAAVYKAIFELGRSTATSIAERAGINRSTAYVVLESLLKEGLLKVSELNGIQYYEGVTNAIMQITEERLKKAREELETGKKLTEELKKLTTTDISNKGGGNVSINTINKTGYSSLFAKELRDEKIIRIFISNTTDSEATSDRLSNFFEALVSFRGKAEILMTNSSHLRNVLLKMTIPDRSIIYLSEHGPNHEGFLAASEKIILNTTAADSFTIIHSAHLATAVTALYEQAIRTAKRWNVKASEPPDSDPPRKKHGALVKAQKRFFDGK